MMTCKDNRTCHARYTRAHEHHRHMPSTKLDTHTRQYNDYAYFAYKKTPPPLQCVCRQRSSRKPRPSPRRHPRSPRFSSKSGRPWITSLKHCNSLRCPMTSGTEQKWRSRRGPVVARSIPAHVRIRALFSPFPTKTTLGTTFFCVGCAFPLVFFIVPWCGSRFRFLERFGAHFGR